MIDELDFQKLSENSGHSMKHLEEKDLLSFAIKLIEKKP